MQFSPRKEDIIDLITLVAVWVFLTNFYTPELMLSQTTTTGGDMGSHYVIAQYLKDYLVPHGQLMGWYPHWLAGMPMLQYYFVPPYLLMVLLSFIMPLQISFKLVTALGIFIMPLLSYLAVRSLGFRFPAPAIAAVFCLPFVFLESYSQFGGNIKSTLAGQFPYGISMAFLFLAIALTYSGMKKNKYLALNAVLIAITTLTHIYTTIAFAGVVALLIIENVVRKKYGEISYLIKTGVLAFLLAGFWIVPLILKYGYSCAPKDVFFGFPDMGQLFIPSFLLFYLIGLIYLLKPLIHNIINPLKPDGSNGYLINLDDRLTPIYYYAIASFLFFALSNHTSLLYVRFMPFLFFIPLMIAAISLGTLTEKLKGNWLIPLIIVFSMMFWITSGVTGLDFLGKDLQSSPYLSQGVKDIPSWIKWNYEGLESKSNWDTFKNLNEYLKSLPDTGRVNIEYSDTYNMYGTPRAFEASPMFNEKDVMEGLLLESSMSFPFYYYLQKEVSKDSWWPGFPLKIPNRNLTRGVEDLRLYNVKYYAVVSDEVKKEIGTVNDYKFLTKIDQFEVYSLNNDSQYIESAAREPVLVITDDWKKYSFPWMSMDYKKVPLVYSKEFGDYERTHFRIIILDKNINLGNTQGMQVFKSEELEAALQASKDITKCSVKEGQLFEEEIGAETDCINKPVLVKISYYPNWMMDGAKKIYMASPSVMLVFPEKQNIKLFYGTVFSDTLGNILTVIGILILAYVLLTRNKTFHDQVHVKVAGFFEKTGIKTTTDKLASGIQTAAQKIWTTVFRNKYKIMAALIIAGIIYAAYTYTSENNACSTSCQSAGFARGEKSFFGNKVDSVSLGFASSGAYPQHNVVCNALCDESRKDTVYIASGYVEFDLKVSPNTENTLYLTLWDNANCRSGNLYINNNLIKTVRGEGDYGWNDFDFKVPTEYTTTGKIKVKLEYDNGACYGWDISGAYVTVPTCRCYK